MSPTNFLNENTFSEKCKLDRLSFENGLFNKDLDPSKHIFNELAPETFRLPPTDHAAI